MIVMVVVVVVIMVMVSVPTGRIIGLSTARFAVVTTAGLAKNHPPPQIAR